LKLNNTIDQRAIDYNQTHSLTMLMLNERSATCLQEPIYRIAFAKMFFIYLKSTWQRAGSATYMPHSLQKHPYKSNTHKIRRKLKTKYNDNKKTTISIWYV